MASRPLPFSLVALGLLSVCLLSGCQDKQAQQQSAQLAASLAQVQDQTKLLTAQLSTLQGQNSDLTKQVQQLQTQVAQLSLRQNQSSNQGQGQSSGTSAGNQTHGTVGGSSAGSSSNSNQTSGTSSGASSASNTLSGSDAEQARLYSAKVHAAYLARMAEDPMYTPDSLSNDTPDCLKAGTVGDRSFGLRPDSLSSCSVTPDGDNDVRVTVKANGQTFVNGAKQGR